MRNKIKNFFSFYDSQIPKINKSYEKVTWVTKKCVLVEMEIIRKMIGTGSEKSLLNT